MAKKTTRLGPSGRTATGVVYCGPGKDEVLPEQDLGKVFTTIRGPGVEIKVHNPSRVPETLAKYRGSYVVT